ncbi:phytosulfokine receptor 2-like [Papaver somniferum]|uniref:phytosulfokine receptor 2-like n=1 Tax=Papaver somniferum TaxID=3469 RepID=UPI000E70156A|nr:phytosulfokine receptor 2-like [Papaver somniferum]
MEPTLQAILAAGASFLAVMFILAGIFLLCKTTTTVPPHPDQQPRNRNRNGTRADRDQNCVSITIDESATYDPTLDRISMPELIKATRNFSPNKIVGDGSFGLVYKARLSNGTNVAVKKLSSDAFQGFREFQAEMETLGKNIRHRNLVRILGYCVSGDDRILIYEFIEKGSLDQWLHHTSSSFEEDEEHKIDIHPLTWEIRVKIIRGVADGLFYLHTLKTPIIHRDIKASNVLLDNEFEAHIADFGLARRVNALHSHVSTQVAGTFGYMPPEYKDGVTVATVKADVYSFGILMIEVATGKRPNLPIKIETGKEIGLVPWAQKMLKEKRHLEIVDESIGKKGLKEKEIGEFLRIACLCTSDSHKDRPVMEDVVKMLDFFN